MLNPGIGWHEARVPTIVTSVPRAAFRRTPRGSRSTCRCRSSRRTGSTCPTSPRRCSPAVADLVSMARPFLADPEWVRKAAESRADEINTCIACNQACLDHTFVNKRATCLVNPRAAHETELVLGPTRTVKKVAVVGAGAGRARRGDDAGRARPRGRALRGARPRRRPVRHRDADPRQGGVRRDDPLLHPPPRPHRGQGAPRPPGRRRRARRRRLHRGRRRHRRRARGCRRSPASTTRWS